MTTTRSECPACGGGPISRRDEGQHFLYGEGAQAVELHATVPVYHCDACDFTFTDVDAENARSTAVDGYLAERTRLDAINDIVDALAERNPNMRNVPAWWPRLGDEIRRQLGEALQLPGFREAIRRDTGHDPIDDEQTLISFEEWVGRMKADLDRFADVVRAARPMAATATGGATVTRTWSGWLSSFLRFMSW